MGTHPILGEWAGSDLKAGSGFSDNNVSKYPQMLEFGRFLLGVVLKLIVINMARREAKQYVARVPL
jgi:hypothetical protein